MQHLLGAVDLLAQSSNNNAAQSAGLAIGIVVALVVMVIALAVVGLLIYLFLFKPLQVIPGQYRKMQPGLTFLVLIPFLGLIWLFFIAIWVPDSFKAYFEGTGRPQLGDYGKSLGLAWAICAVCGFIPFVGFLASLGALVCMILFLVKINGLKNLVAAGGPGPGGFQVVQ